MIMPNMATMISVLTSDAPVPAKLLHEALLEAVGKSFNKVTVDGDTSTNDTCVLFASGKAAEGKDKSAFTKESVAYAEFKKALCEVTQQMCIRDRFRLALHGIRQESHIDRYKLSSQRVNNAILR